MCRSVGSEGRFSFFCVSIVEYLGIVPQRVMVCELVGLLVSVVTFTLGTTRACGLFIGLRR